MELWVTTTQPHGAVGHHHPASWCCGSPPPSSLVLDLRLQLKAQPANDPFWQDRGGGKVKKAVMVFLRAHVLERRARKTHSCQGYDSGVDICSGSRTDKIQMSINAASPSTQLCFDNSSHTHTHTHTHTNLLYLLS